MKNIKNRLSSSLIKKINEISLIKTLKKLQFLKKDNLYIFFKSNLRIYGRILFLEYVLIILRIKKIPWHEIRFEIK